MFVPLRFALIGVVCSRPVAERKPSLLQSAEERVHSGQTQLAVNCLAPDHSIIQARMMSVGALFQHG